MIEIYVASCPLRSHNYYSTFMQGAFLFSAKNFPGFAFLHFQAERSVHLLIDECYNYRKDLFFPLSTSTAKNKPVRCYLCLRASVCGYIFADSSIAATYHSYPYRIWPAAAPFLDPRPSREDCKQMKCFLLVFGKYISCELIFSWKSCNSCFSLLWATVVNLGRIFYTSPVDLRMILMDFT